MASGGDRTTEASPATKATLRDVAQLAGVSHATASKALNNRDRVSEATRQRVLIAAKQLDFRPNALARGLSSRRSGSVGLLTSRLEGRFVLPMLRGAEDAFGTGSLSVLLADTRGDAIREAHHLNALLDRQVDGIILMGSRTAPRPSVGNLPVPVVYAYSPSQDDSDLSLVPDNREAGAMQAQHLLSGGRTRLAIITGSADYTEARDRAEGAASVIAQQSAAELVTRPLYGSWSEHWGTAAALSVLEAHDVDGIICGNDQIARGVLRAAELSQRPVPSSLAVIGFDNWRDILDGATPTLSSVDMNLERLGAEAARLLLEPTDMMPATGPILTPCSLIERESTLIAAVGAGS